MATDPEDVAHPLNDPVFVIGRHRLPYAPLDRIFLNQPDLAGSLFLIRHGRQEMPRTVNREHFLDPPLDDVGRRQALAVAERMKRFDLQWIYCSDLQRARDTAQAVADATGVPIAGELPELREIDLYRDLAVAEDSITPSDGFRLGLISLFARTRRWGSFPYGESSEDFRARVEAAVEGILALTAGGNVAIVCHAGVISAYVAEILGVRADMVFNPAHCSITWLRYAPDARREIHSLNLVGHLIDDDLLTY
ncbi:hypothetical protein GCM10009547_18140 [Sporichthya brevicatena]|uniref:Histidine phosphatase family protein n=1 Tax=Sporichthya brevicatena TaxID=171442 RepID=A0ABN1GQF0_9ACTN